VLIETSNLVYRFTIASPTLLMKKLPWMGRGHGQVTRFRILHTYNISEIAEASEDWLSRKWAWSGVGVSNFYIVNLENFATRRRSACGLHLRRSSVSWLNARVYYTLVHCNPLILILRFFSDLSYKLLLHCYASVGKNSTDTSHRAVRLRQQSFFFYFVKCTSRLCTCRQL